MKSEGEQTKMRRVAGNSVMLYLRMLLIMGVSLYTSRVVLRTLGIEDYGLLNVVAGIITMLSCLSGPLASAASRFLTVALGKGDRGEVEKVFQMTKLIEWLLAGVVVLLGETVGLWFVSEKLVIPPQRLWAAQWVYQFSIVSFVVTLLSVPYNALIIAHERMRAFAMISVLEVTVKLGFVVFLVYSPWDRLVTYGLLLTILQVGIRGVYGLYCKRHFPESRSGLRPDAGLLKKMFAYSAWCSTGYLAIVGYTQGLNVLLNLFFGPAVNAARAVALQVQAAVGQVGSNIQVAANPQITKSYASGNLSYLHRLLGVSSKGAFFVVLAVVFPLEVHAPYLLELWLHEVPAHTVAFVRITLAVTLVECLRDPLLSAIHATGRIRKFQLLEGGVLLLIVPLAYLMLRFSSAPPECVFVIYLGVEVLTQGVRMWLVLPQISLRLGNYAKEVLYPVGSVSVAVGASSPAFRCAESFWEMVSVALLQVGVVGFWAWLLGLTKRERGFLLEQLGKRMRKKSGPQP